MSDTKNLRVEPTPAVRGPAPVKAATHELAAATPVPGDRRPTPGHATPAAATGGNLRPAYAQISVNPDSHDFVISVRDAATDQVISETPSPEVEAMSKSLQDYAAALARHQAANKSSAGK
jgi:hypothetical protein